MFRNSLICLSAFFFAFNISAQTLSDQTTTAPASPTSPVCTRPLNVGWTDYPPFQEASPEPRVSSLPVGAEIDLLNQIGKNTGCTFVYKKIPFSRQLFDLKLGVIDLIFSGANSADLASYAYLSKPYRTEVIHLFVRQNEVGKYQISKIDDLKDSQIVWGTKRGFYYGPEFANFYKQSWFIKHIEENNHSIMNLKKLVYGRIDGVLLEIPVEKEFEKNSHFSQLITLHPFILYKGPVRILFSKKTVDPKIVDAFNNQLDLLDKDNTIQRILAKYSALE